MDCEASDEPHWVETLFPPTYTLSDVAEARTLVDKQASSHHASMRRIVPLDADSVRAIYERVLLMEKVKAEVPKFSTNDESQKPIMQTAPQSVPGPDHGRQLPGCRLPTPSIGSASEAPEGDHQRAGDVGNGCLWTPTELAAIREARRAQDAELVELRLHAAQLEQDLARSRVAEAVAARDRDDLTTRQAELVKRERRLTTACRKLVAELDAERRIAAGRDLAAADLRRRQADLERQLEEARADAGRLRAVAARAEADAASAAARVKGDLLAVIESQRTAHAAQLVELNSKLSCAEEQAASERAAHARSRLALDRLLEHFSTATPTPGAAEATFSIQY